MTATIGDTATLAHGYTMAELDNMTRMACKTYPRSLASIDYGDAHEEAWFAIVERLYSSTERPTLGDLVSTGRDALRDLVNDHRRHHGIHQTTGQPTKSFTKVWSDPTRRTEGGFTDRIVERLSLAQVLGVLSGDEYEVLAALAVHSDHDTAARSLGLARVTFNGRLARARRSVLALWFEHETPHRKTRSDVACERGHLRTEHSIRTANGRWRCEKCRKISDRAGARRRRTRDRVSASPSGEPLSTALGERGNPCQGPSRGGLVGLVDPV